MRTLPNMIARSLRVACPRVTGLKAEGIHIRKSTSVHVITLYLRTAVIKLNLLSTIYSSLMIYTITQGYSL